MYTEKVASNVIIQYGGSVNKNNIKEILSQNGYDFLHQDPLLIF